MYNTKLYTHYIGEKKTIDINLAQVLENIRETVLSIREYDLGFKYLEIGMTSLKYSGAMEIFLSGVSKTIIWGIVLWTSGLLIENIG